MDFIMREIFEKGVTQTYDAPSISLGNLSKVYQIFKNIEKELKQMK